MQPLKVTIRDAVVPGGRTARDEFGNVYGGKLAKEAEILLYEEIGYWAIDAKMFADTLQEIGDVDSIVLGINSDGGDAFDGIAMFNALVRHPAKVTVRIDGIAASAASLVAMAGEAHHEMVKAEEALFKTTRLALEERKMLGLSQSEQLGRAAFTGKGDAIPVPPELDAGEREVIRSLVYNLQQEVRLRAERRQTVIDAKVQAASTHEEKIEEAKEANRFGPADEDTTPSAPPAPDDFPLG